MQETLRLVADVSEAGAPVFEEVLVERRGPQRYRLLRSPGFVLGLAADDIFDVDTDGNFNIVERGRNICIQVFSSNSLDQVETAATLRLSRLGGRLDGKARKVLVYTVAVSVGFGPIEQAMREIVESVPDTEWGFGNVYDPKDGVTPLNWWKE